MDTHTHHTHHTLHRMYREMGNSKLEMFHMVVLYPMWVFGVTAIPTYIALFVHILGRGNNWGHVLHAIVSSNTLIANASDCDSEIG